MTRACAMDWDFDDDCPECGGSGIVYSCFSEYECVDPEAGCDLCECPCDLCSPIATTPNEPK